MIDLIDFSKPRISYLNRSFKDPDNKELFLGKHYI